MGSSWKVFKDLRAKRSKKKRWPDLTTTLVENLGEPMHAILWFLWFFFFHIKKKAHANFWRRIGEAILGADKVNALTSRRRAHDARHSQGSPAFALAWCISSHVVPAHAFGKLRVASFNCDPTGMNPIPEQYQNKPGPRPSEFTVGVLPNAILH